MELFTRRGLLSCERVRVSMHAAVGIILDQQSHYLTLSFRYICLPDYQNRLHILTVFLFSCHFYFRNNPSVLR